MPVNRYITVPASTNIVVNSGQILLDQIGQLTIHTA